MSFHCNIPTLDLVQQGASNLSGHVKIIIISWSCHLVCQASAIATPNIIWD